MLVVSSGSNAADLVVLVVVDAAGKVVTSSLTLSLRNLLGLTTVVSVAVCDGCGTAVASSRVLVVVKDSVMESLLVETVLIVDKAVVVIVVFSFTVEFDGGGAMAEQLRAGPVDDTTPNKNLL